MKHLILLSLSIVCILFLGACTESTEQETPAQDAPETAQHIGKDGDHAHDGAHKHGHAIGEANNYMNSMLFETLVERFENPERAEWQKPELVVAHLGNLNGLTVVDLGAGTGYFSVPLAEAGAQVIALDIDDRFLEYIEERKANLPADVQARIQTRKTPIEKANIDPHQADRILTVNTYHHFDNRVEYFRDLMAGLQPGGELVIVDFQPGDLPVGPPEGMKIFPDRVMEELTEAGYEDITIDHRTLPYQFIITARLPG